MSAWENSRHFATPPLVSPREMTSEKRLQKCFTTQIWVVILIGRGAKEICFSQSEALPRSVISVEFLRSFVRRHFAGNPMVKWRKWRLFVQTRAVHAIYLLSLKIFYWQFFAWLRNNFSFCVFFFFGHRWETVKNCSLQNRQCDAAARFTKSAATAPCGWYAHARC